MPTPVTVSKAKWESEELPRMVSAAAVQAEVVINHLGAGVSDTTKKRLDQIIRMMRRKGNRKKVDTIQIGSCTADHPGRRLP